MKEKSAKKKVFISYAREDQGQAEKIYQYLSDANFDPWMDVHDIVSGDDWLKSITRSIKQSDYFLAILSRNSVNKPGVLQQELDIALEICKKITDPEIFLIPVRLEECKMPERISQYQWVNLFAEDGWVRLLRALHQKRQLSRKWYWRLLLPLTSLLLVAGFLTVRAAYQPVKPDPAIYENSCTVSEEPLQVGVVRQEDCLSDYWPSLESMWGTEPIQITALDQSIFSSQEAQDLTGYDLIIWGSCTNQTSLHFELTSSRKPDELYEPTSFQVTGTVTEVGDVGKALISYQRGDYEGAAQRFAASALAADSAELAMLRSNSLMFSGNYEEAIAVLKDSVLAQAPEWGAAYNNLGIALFNLELLQEKSGYISSGLYEFDRAVQYADAGKDAEALLLAYTNKGDLLRRVGNWEDAESACRAALVSSSQTSSPYICLVLYKLSRYAGSSQGVPFPEIQDDLNKAKQLGTTSAKFYYLQAGLYRMQKQNQEALADYEHFLEIMQDRACLALDWSYIDDTARYIAALKR